MSGEDRLPTDLVEETRLQRALRESVILRELAEILNSSLDLEHILQALVKRTTELCEVARCAVWLLEEPWNRFRAVTYYIASPELARELGQTAGEIWYRTHLPVDSPVIQRLLAEGGILFLEDLRTEESVRPMAETFQAHSMLLIALAREGRPVGIMALDDPGQIRTFSHEQQQLARAIGQQATIAIDNARLYQQAQVQQQRAENLIQRARAIYQVAMTVNSGEELPAVLRLATGHLVRALEANDGLAMLLEENETLLRPVGPVSYNLSDTFSTAQFSLDSLPNCRRAIETGKPILISAKQAEGQEDAWLRQLNLNTILVVPLMGSPPQRGANWDLPGETKGTLLVEGEDAQLADLYCHGLIVLYYQRHHRPTRGEYAFAQDIAAQCALAIEKARLLAEAQRSANLANERANTLNAVFQAMTEGITVLTSDEQVLTRNNAAARFLGVPVDSSSSIKTFLCQHPTFTLDGQPVSYEDFPLTRALHNGTEVRGERLLITGADGTPRVMEITATPLRNSSQQQMGLVTAFRDITVQVQAEESIRQALETLREADSMKNEFLAITAHEFRNPLTVILARSQSALRALRRADAETTPAASSSVADHLEIIIGQTKQLNDIVTTFLDAARINQGKFTLKNESVDLGKIAQQVVSNQSNLVERHTLHCSLQEQEEPYLVIGDQARLAQIIANLVENAIKYSPFGGPVTVSLRRNQHGQSPGFVEVSIKDQGMGIPPEAQARLFERFYRVPHVVGSETRGVGLGLYIVAKLVQLHGGKIHVESSGVPGEGSCFRFTLPELTSPAEGDV